MQRRFFIFSSLTTFLSSLTFSKIKALLFKNNNNYTTVLTENKSPLIVLSPGENFSLPEKAIDGMYLGFELKMKTSSCTAHIVSSGKNLIYGTDTILEVDSSQRFFLIYFSDSNMWMPTLEDPGLFKNGKNKSILT